MSLPNILTPSSTGEIEGAQFGLLGLVLMLLFIGAIYLVRIIGRLDDARSQQAFLEATVNRLKAENESLRERLRAVKPVAPSGPLLTPVWEVEDIKELAVKLRDLAQAYLEEVRAVPRDLKDLHAFAKRAGVLEVVVNPVTGDRGYLTESPVTLDLTGKPLADEGPSLAGRLLFQATEQGFLVLACDPSGAIIRELSGSPFQLTEA